jgi:hypothetical protein
MLTKKALTAEEIDTLVALELPPRETPALAVITCLAVCIGEIRIQVSDVNVAAQICAEVLSVNVLGVSYFDCKVKHH